MTAREDYQELMQNRLDDWKSEIEQFKVGAGKIEADARANYDKGSPARKRLDRLKPENNWCQC